jgi:hypothetical protein
MNKTVLGSCRNVDSSIVGEWRKEQFIKIINAYKPQNIFNADETGLYFKLPPIKTLSLKWDPCNGGKIPKDWVMILLAYNADGTTRLPPLIIGKSESPCCFKIIRNFLTKYVTN